MGASGWFLVVGLLLVGVTFSSPLLDRLRVPLPLFYLGIGLLLGPGALGLLSGDLVREARLFERLTEIAVIVSLFTVGLNIRRSPTDRAWQVPLRLATLTMLVTIAAVAAAGAAWMGLSIGAAILLGAILAPTDPVLASDVQLSGPTDRDALRHGLSGEAGLNDGSAFPFVMLGLGLLGLHPDADSGLLGMWGDQAFGLPGWFAWDLVWATAAGLVVGGAVGWLIGHGTLLLQRRPGVSIGLHEFLVLGLIALAYGLAELIYAYGFLAVFAAGYALRYIELRAAAHAPHPAELPPLAPGERSVGDEALADPEKAAAFLAASLLDFNDKLERILMAAVVVLVGGVLTVDRWSADVVWLAPFLFLVARPAATVIGLAGAGIDRVRLALTAWFGIRGIGSLFYLTYAIEHGLPAPLAERLSDLVLSLVVVSVVVHGATTVPLMSWYEGRRQERVGPERQRRID